MSKFESNINILFRYDDPSAISNTELELQILKIFSLHEIPLLFGVVPFETKPFSQEKADLFLQWINKNILDVALHGVTHTRPNKNTHEFMGFEYYLLYNRLREGKELLEQLFNKNISIYIPPWNRNDENTVKALHKLGITCISADVTRGVAPSSIPMQYLPFTTYILDLLDTIRESIDYCIESQLITCILHEYDFNESGSDNAIISIDKFSDILDILDKMPNVCVISFKEAIEKYNNELSGKRFNAYYKVAVPSEKLLPISRIKHLGWYPSTMESHRLVLRMRGISTAIYSLIFLCTILFSYGIAYALHILSGDSIDYLTASGITLMAATAATFFKFRSYLKLGIKSFWQRISYRVILFWLVAIGIITGLLSYEFL